MTANDQSGIVRTVPGDKPTASQVLEGRAAARANHGPTHEQIALRAFQIFQAHGSLHGRHTEDWMQAERELRRNG